MFYLSLAFLFIINVFFKEYNFVLSILFSVLFTMSLVKRNKNVFVYYLLLLLTNFGLYIISINILLLFVYFYDKKTSNELFFVDIFYIILVVIFSLMLFFNHSNIYDVSRYLVLVFSPVFFMLFFNKKMIENARLKSIPIFIVISSSNLAYVLIFHFGERLSVFSGSENISLIIFTFLLIFVLSERCLLKYKILCVFLYLINIYIMDSRSVILLAVPFFIAYVFSYKWWTIKKISVLYIYIFLFFLIGYFLSDRVLSIFDVFLDGEVVFEGLNFFSYDIDLSSFYTFDIRPKLYEEAIRLIFEKPWFGHGYVNPVAFSELGVKDGSSFHSSILSLWVSYGFLGVFILGLFLWSVISMIHKRNKNMSNKMVINSIVYAFFILSLVQPYLFNFQVYSLFLFFLLFSGQKKYLWNSEQ